LFNLKVDQFARKNQLFTQGATILIGVSGGPDSMALLHYFLQKREAWRFRLVALTIDHQLRGKYSEQDVQYVASFCENWGIEYKVASLDVSSYKEKHGLGTQAAARALRYQFFEEAMGEYQADLLALGHHGDDQVETLYMGMMRGVEPMHIKGIPEQRPLKKGKLIRPFLGVTKEEIEVYCSEHKIHPRYDESNKSMQYTRNAFRMKVLPFLKEYNPKIHEHMQKYHEYREEDEVYFLREAERFFESESIQKQDLKIVVDRADFLSIPRPLQRRTFHLILNYLYQQTMYDGSYLHWEQYIRMMEDETPQASIDMPQGLTVVRSYETVTFSFEQTEVIPFHYSLPVPGEVQLPNGAMIKAFTDDRGLEMDENHFACDINNITLPLKVRTRHPGDRISIRGMDGHKKVKNLFIDEKISQKERDQWPIVTDAKGQLLWVVSLKKARIEENSMPDTWLHLTYKNQENF